MHFVVKQTRNERRKKTSPKSNNNEKKTTMIKEDDDKNNKYTTTNNNQKTFVAQIHNLTHLKAKDQRLAWTRRWKKKSEDWRNQPGDTEYLQAGATARYGYPRHRGRRMHSAV